ncbi:hypothetical protein B0T09DRAFT_142627 [Sordaria sp. MPI-SDFR-AT-0083]|nr:hypothetical protein B0T09DRAFT_142627 [Sordaria sp. MPI-SDFR-AT-0083]
MIQPSALVLLAVSLFTPAASAHGEITSPPARLPGPAMAQACGQQAVNAVLADSTMPIESVPFSSSSSCNSFLCRGALFADNASLLQRFTPGQTIPFKASIPIPHEGPCNVSVVNTQTNSVVGQPLLVFDSYADERLARLPANNTAFSVTLPTDGEVLKECGAPGVCVLQWFWFGEGARQTYESCVDFVVEVSTGVQEGAAQGGGEKLNKCGRVGKRRQRR